MTYSCNICGKTYKRKGWYDKHMLCHNVPIIDIPNNSDNNNIDNTKMPLKPIIKWSGGKKDEIHLFQKHIPTDYNIYIEPFIGGGSVYFHLVPAKAVIADVHKELICFYKSIKDGHSDEIYQFM